ncbi:hypothetical protein DXG01_003767 [Tephrocybe rancida]|nr:hypothetical protein DXG01_003767 [Tephrocybe rancida]
MLLRRYQVSGKHEYCYARILGIYHVNAMYYGPLSRDAVAHRLDFVWVRWFEMVDGHDIPVSQAWSRSSPLGMTQLKFPPTTRREAFGFLDPNDILRACHIVPRFQSEQRGSDVGSLSGLAQDGKDWQVYYLNRFVDRDMLMRFHWGLGVGHTSSRSSVHSARLPSPLTQPMDHSTFNASQSTYIDLDSPIVEPVAEDAGVDEGAPEEEEDSSDDEVNLSGSDASGSDEEETGNWWASDDGDFNEMYGD